MESALAITHAASTNVAIDFIDILLSKKTLDVIREDFIPKTSLTCRASDDSSQCVPEARSDVTELGHTQAHAEKSGVCVPQLQRWSAR